MLLIFKPSGATTANPEMALKLGSLLQDNPDATALKVKTDISDAPLPFIHSLPTTKKGSEILLAGQGCGNTILANLFSLWDRGVAFKIKKHYVVLCAYGVANTWKIVEGFFGKNIWEDE